MFILVGLFLINQLDQHQPTFDPNKDYYTGSDEEDKDDEGGATTTSGSDYSPTDAGP